MPHSWTVEPDQAQTQGINLLRARKQFSIEIDPRLRGMKDVVAIHLGGVLEQLPGWTNIRNRALCLDDACQFLYNCIKEELSFQVNPEWVGGEWQWLFLIEVRSSGRRE